MSALIATITFEYPNSYIYFFFTLTSDPVNVKKKGKKEEHIRVITGNVFRITAISFELSFRLQVKPTRRFWRDANDYNVCTCQSRFSTDLYSSFSNFYCEQDAINLILIAKCTNEIPHTLTLPSYAFEKKQSLKKVTFFSIYYVVDVNNFSFFCQVNIQQQCSMEIGAAERRCRMRSASRRFCTSHGGRGERWRSLRDDLRAISYRNS